MKRTRDIIYGRKCGMALTLDLLEPDEPKGRGILLNVASGWVSDHAFIDDWMEDRLLPMVERGYTVFVVCTCSAPKFTMADLADDLHRAVRFVRTNAQRFGVDGEKLGLSGFSAGGHLSMTVGFSPRPGDPEAKDGVERESSEVRAIGQFYGPTDFLNYGEAGSHAFEGGILGRMRYTVDFQEFDWEDTLLHSVKNKTEIMMGVSPMELIHAEAPPTLLIHGDLDSGVPLQQSRVVYEKLLQLGVPTKLLIKEGAGHGWVEMKIEMGELADWFDEWLR